ncbi:hypothetical protein [Streptomyces sp. NPDC014733]|uniref:hypothetical protein n=1 Tax=Streptomyces sp. NPDC014733 TaxID=3364885 RepID=UPI0036FF95F8
MNGKPLRAIILSRSHGVDRNSFRAAVHTLKVNGKWDVAGVDLRLGNASQP